MISASTDGMRIWNNKLACETYIAEDVGYQKLLSTNEYIIATKTNGYINIYKNSPPHNKLFTLFGHKGNIKDICRIHKLGEGNTEITKSNLVATGGEDATIRIWDLDQQFSIWVIQGAEGHSHSIQCLIQHSTGCLISGGLDSKIFIWDIYTRKIINTLILGDDNHISGFIELFDGGLLSYYNNSELWVKIWDKGESVGKEFPAIKSNRYGFTSCAQISDAKVLLGTDNGKLCIYHPKPNYLTYCYNIHTNAINQIRVINHTDKKSIDMYQKSLSDSELNIKEFNSLGNAYYLQGEYEKAIEMHKKSIDLHKKYYKSVPHLTLAVNYSNLAQNYIEIGEFDLAETFKIR